MDSIDLCETLDWHTAKNGKNLYGWSTAFNNRVKSTVWPTRQTAMWPGKTMMASPVPTSAISFSTAIPSISGAACCSCCPLSLLFLALCYKNVRIAYELVVSRLLAFLFAADIGGGES